MKTKTHITIITILFFVFPAIKSLNAETWKSEENIYKRFTAIQCDSLIKANETNPDFVILDVRTPGEWESYHIFGSINRSTGLSDFAAQLNVLPKHKIFLLHCQSGGRSAGAFTKMKEMGFTEVYEMIGGINAWKNASLPVTTGVQPKLMLVSYLKTLPGAFADTLKITVTNRANGELTFSAVSFTDVHHLENNFNPGNILKGAEDYTFSVIHSPAYSEIDSTKIQIESNGGTLELNIVFKNGEIQGIADQNLSELVIFPNPASEKLFFKSGTNTMVEEICISNIAGQVLIHQTSFSDTDGINISGLKNGLYIVQIKSSNQVLSKKIVIKH